MCLKNVMQNCIQCGFSFPLLLLDCCCSIVVRVCECSLEWKRAGIVASQNECIRICNPTKVSYENKWK